MPLPPGTWLLRLAVVLSVASLAALVLYFTPLPELAFASCDRPCHELDWPMICRYKLVLESHHSMGAWCGDCPGNSSDCAREGCVLADGSPRPLLTANRRLPGPSIQVCENDILVVDVVNRVAGGAVAVHWRGQPQRESPYMDGVPMLTQCPISSYTTFQYKFRAEQAGTHLWHTHTGNELLDGVFGSLIVRKADRVEEARPLYDRDEKTHVLILSGWGSSILINGLSSALEELIPKFTVEGGLRYRLRVAHAGGTRCPFYFHIEDHSMTIFSLDGRHIQPIKANTFRIAHGERVDFVLEASAKTKLYSILVESNCTKELGFAKLVYNTSVAENPPVSNLPQHQPIKTTKLLSTITDKECDKSSSDVVCLPEMRSLNKLPLDLQKKRADVTLYLPFDYIQIAAGSSGLKELRPRLNNITFMFPPSPLLSQGEGGGEVVCSDTKPKECDPPTELCQCTHVVHVPLQSLVEIILFNQDFSSQNGDHVFHLHGQGFYLTSLEREVPVLSGGELERLDRAGALLRRNLAEPVLKDTISVPRSGAVALRFKATNPGYWLLHEQSPEDWSRGLDVVLKVGERQDFPPTPDNFPKCGSWVGPEFFLI